MTRRIVSKLYEKELRRYLKFANPQRGFISSPGCLLNISKLASILAHAKKGKSECHAVLLDVRKAFDTVGHDHIEKTLVSIGIPASLRTVCAASIKGNITKIQSIKGFTRGLEMLAGVAQGEPLSPLLFNIAINFIVEKINVQEVREKYGYDDGSGACSVLSFADDTTLIGHNVRAVQHLIEMTNSAFSDIGLTLNAMKTSWLAVNTADEHEHLTLVDHLLKPTSKHELVRYLGAYFCPLQDFNGEEALQKFQTKLERVLQSDLITSHQKLQLLQQYLFPVLNFSFQVTPSKLISEQWSERIDKIVASAMRELLRLRNGTTNEFLYAPRTCRGLAIVHYKQETRLQRLTGLSMLLKEASVEEMRKSILDEAEGCFRGLQIQCESVESKLVQPNLSVVLRKILRERSFDAWSGQASAVGVHLYKLVPASNRWITKKQPMTHQDWITSMQLTTNTCDLAACRHPAPPTQNCRRCTVVRREAHRETLGHVLGYCCKNNGFIINRHDAVVKLLRDELRKIGHTVYYEDRCIGTTLVEITRDVDGDAAQNVEQSRRVDLVVVDKSGSIAYLIDPTIRMEYDEASVGLALQQKLDTYLPTIPYYRENLNISNIEVHGVWFGSRGAHHPTTISLFRRLGLIKGKNMTILDTITKLILQHSSAILRNHIV